MCNFYDIPSPEMLAEHFGVSAPGEYGRHAAPLSIAPFIRQDMDCQLGHWGLFSFLTSEHAGGAWQSLQPSEHNMDNTERSPIQTLVQDAKDNDFQIIVWSSRTIISRCHKVGLDIAQDGTIRKKVSGECLSLNQARDYLGLDRIMVGA